MTRWLKVRSATRLSLSIAAITALIAWAALELRVIPNPDSEKLTSRIQFAETMALQSTANIQANRIRDFSRLAEALVKRNQDLTSMGLRRANGRYAFATNGHQASWDATSRSTSEQVSVQIDINQKSWGSLEIGFAPRVESLWFSRTNSIVFFLAAGVGFMSWIVLSRTLRYLNPSSVIPNRVRSAFETLVEGLMLLDQNGVIVHANGKLSEMVDVSLDELIGQRVSDVNWQRETEQEQFSWDRCLVEKEQVCGQLLKLERNGVTFMYTANAAPIFESNGSCRGALVSFDDVTALENKKADLARMVNILKESRDQVTEQNKKLQFLASRDPLTKCYNRRSFWELVDDAWAGTEPDRLSLIMIDIDYFKSINDTHGHSVGDDVLRELGEFLQSHFNETGTVCRFGGEEFAVLLNDLEFDEACAVATEFGKQLRSTTIGGLEITASIGVSNRCHGAMDPQHLLDQADRCLYVAKRSGRDRVVAFDPHQCQEMVDDPSDIETKAVQHEHPIEYSTVTGLLTALAFRSTALVEKAIRVSEISVALGKKFFPTKQLYELEIAALLHNIGMIGISDSLLSSESTLTIQELQLWNRRSEISAEIVRLAFGCRSVTEMIRCQHYWFAAPNPAVNQTILKQEIPIGARVIGVCSLVDDLIHEQQLSMDDAVTALMERDTEYDPELSEMLALVVKESPELLQCSVRHDTSPKFALSIGRYVESFSQGVDAKDIGVVKSCLQSLKEELSDSKGCEFSEVTSRLEVSLQKIDPEFDEIDEMAQELMDLCREVRNRFFNATEFQELTMS